MYSCRREVFDTFITTDTPSTYETGKLLHFFSAGTKALYNSLDTPVTRVRSLPCEEACYLGVHEGYLPLISREASALLFCCFFEYYHSRPGGFDEPLPIKGHMDVFEEEHLRNESTT